MNKYRLGVDVGGTKTKIALLPYLSERKPDCFEMETPKNLKVFEEGLALFIKQSIAGKKIVSAGICLPGVVDVGKKIIIECHNLQFLNGWKAGKFLEKFCKKTAIENDSRAFLEAEIIMGNMRKYKNVAGVTVGTGIGGGIFINGKPYRGFNGGAGEFGKMILDGGKTFETLGNKSTVLNPEERNKIIGIGIANIINSFNPEAVIIGGGVITSGAVDIKAVAETALANVPYLSMRKVKILPTKLGYYSSAIGAALLLN